MRLSFQHLLTLIVKHEIFPDPVPLPDGLMLDERTSDLLELVPEEKTLRLLQQNSLILKKIKNTFQIFFQKEGPRKSNLKNLENTDLYFRILIKDSNFFSITDASYLSPSINQIVFFGPLLNESLASKVRKVYGQSFCYPLANELRPVQVTVNALRGEKIIDETVSESKIKCLEIDLRKEGEGAFSITEDTKRVDGIFISDIYSSLQKDKTVFYGVACFRFNNISDPYEQKKFIIQFKKNK